MSYAVFVTPQAWREMKTLPGNVRQRVKREVDGLRGNPRPPQSKQLAVAVTGVSLFRIRLNRWRLIYALKDDKAQIFVLAIRKRPPYTYDDLDELLALI